MKKSIKLLATFLAVIMVFTALPLVSVMSFAEDVTKKVTTSNKANDDCEGEIIPFHSNHNYGSEITKEPNCIEDGVRTYTCAECGYTYDETIPKTPDVHTWEKFTDDEHKCKYCQTTETHIYKNHVCVCGQTDKNTCIINCTAYTKATLTLSWDKIDGVKGYKIYCAQLDKYYKVKGADVTSYKVQNLKECKNYDFTICYFVNNGNGDIYSEYSSSFRYCTRPSPIIATEIRSGSSGSTHSFTVTHTTVNNVSGYEVKYQLVGAKNYKTYNRTNEEPKTIEVTKAGTYTVWTRAYKSAYYDGVNKFKANGDWSDAYTVEVK